MGYTSGRPHSLWDKAAWRASCGACGNTKLSGRCGAGQGCSRSRKKLFNPGAVGKAEITTAEKSLAFIQIIPCYQRVWSEGETLLE